MKYICTKKCYFDRKLYEEGEMLSSLELPNKHFRAVKEEEVKRIVEVAKKKKIAEKKADIKSLSELQNEEAEALLVGRRKKR